MSDDLIEDIEAELPPPPGAVDPAPADIVLDLSPEEAARLAELTESVNERYGAKKGALDLAQEWVDQGNELIAIKAIVGHSNFGHYIVQTCNFSHSTALNWMRIAKAVETDTIKLATVALFGLKAALWVVGNLVDPVTAKKRTVAEAYASYSARMKRIKSPLKKALANIDWKALASAQVVAKGAVVDLDHAEWPRPTEKGQALQVYWRQSIAASFRDRDHVIYIWSPTQNVLPGPELYKWSYFKYGEYEWINYHFEVCEEEYGETWEVVTNRLREWSKKFANGGAYKILGADPARCEILEHLLGFMLAVDYQQKFDVTESNRSINESIARGLNKDRVL